MRDADDSPVWAYALDNGAVIVTKDEDFPHRLSQKPREFPWCSGFGSGNTSRRALLEWFEPQLPKIETLIEQGDRLVEVR